MVITSYDIAACYLFGSLKNDYYCIRDTSTSSAGRFGVFCDSAARRSCDTPPELGPMPRTKHVIFTPEEHPSSYLGYARRPLLRALFSLEINCVSILP